MVVRPSYGASRLILRLGLLLCWRGDGSQLLHQAQGVQVGPAFHRLAFSDAGDDHPLHREWPAGRWYPHELSLMSTPHRVAERRFVPLAEDILEREVQIGEGVTDRGDDLSVTLGARALPREGRMVDVVGGEVAVYGRQVPFVPDLLDDLVDKGLVPFCRHGASSFLPLPPAVSYTYLDSIPNPDETEDVLQRSAEVLSCRVSFREDLLAAIG